MGQLGPFLHVNYLGHPMTQRPTAVIVSAYGSAHPSPLSDEDIYAYLKHITQFYRSVDPEPELFEHLKNRFEKSGPSPMYPMTETVARKLQVELDKRDLGTYDVRFAMKHSPPLLEEVAHDLTAQGFEKAVSLPLAPFRSRMSTEGYHKLARRGVGDEESIEWRCIDGWHMDETFLAMWEGLIRAALPDGDGLVTIFTNHSLPVHIRKWDDPYESDFRATASALADRCGLGDWDCAFQSVGGGGGATEWLGPDLPEILRKWKDKGHGNFLLAPIGFLNAHLEVSYDIDIDLQATAKNMAVTVTRTDMPDDNPLFIQTLADRVMGVVGDQSSVMTA